MTCRKFLRTPTNAVSCMAYSAYKSTQNTKYFILNTMIILGIDPGTRRIGYGLIKKDGSALSLVSAGLLSVTATNDADALLEIKMEADRIIRQNKPGLFVIEKLYFSKNQKTALKVAEARGALVLSAMEAGLPIEEFSPNEVKMAVTGYGSADKKAVLKMVRLILKTPSLKVIDDASDALALAIAGSGRLKFNK